MKQSLKARLFLYLYKHPEWIASGELQRLVMEKTTYTAQNVGRRMRELENDGKVIVEYRKGHAYYKIAPPKETKDYYSGGMLVAQRKLY